MIPLDSLIKIGETQELKNEQLEFMSKFDKINRLATSSWKEELLNINNTDIVSLFKGIIIAERNLKWIGGSVAGGIWIYREITLRNLDKDYQIANWALKNSKNEYIPFGSFSHNKKM